MEIHEGELVVVQDSPLRPGPPERAFVRTPAKTVTASAPAASLTEIDRAITDRHAKIGSIDRSLESLDQRIANTGGSSMTLVRLKTLISGSGKPTDTAALKAERDALMAERGRLAGELDELALAREPLAAEERVYTYDTVVRPKLRAAVLELSQHLAAAERTLCAAKDVIEDGERLHGMGMARAMISSSRNRGELPSPDGRELPLLKVWRDLLVDAPPNICKLHEWHDDCAVAGVASAKDR